MCLGLGCLILLRSECQYEETSKIILQYDFIAIFVLSMSIQINIYYGPSFHTFIDSSAATSFPNWQKLRSSLVICLFIGLNPAKKRNDVTGTRLLEPRMINVFMYISVFFDLIPRSKSILVKIYLPTNAMWVLSSDKWIFSCFKSSKTSFSSVVFILPISLFNICIQLLHFKASFKHLNWILGIVYWLSHL